ncbi:helix-turn-helix transcriptional regulator [Celeribacter neptunius]|uniref:Regulatory protein, luxR family n=1 Tax=Celeribacter neptunius TaxID=588602 RepID=A0A1I3UCP3_9RHOB|nr:helix-turn-helix transcriptional regulator [Celeribacter neptunius]SFJ80682.1 regulatory protein, luxR family [Celeribacter neptunius]
MHEDDETGMKDKLAIDFLVALGPVIGCSGQDTFYPSLARELANFFNTNRYLVIRYAMHAKPEFLSNHAMQDTAVSQYLDQYYRIDPLLRQVREGGVKPVLTFDELRQRSADTFFYDAMFRTAQIRDELIFMLPIVNEVYVAICIDRSSTTFSEQDIFRAKLIFDTINMVHQQHIRLSFVNYGTTDLKNSDIAMLVKDRKDREIFRNTSWGATITAAMQRDIDTLVAATPSGEANLGPDCILKWSELSDTNPVAPAGQVLTVEQKALGYATLEASDLVDQLQEKYQLTSRERQIVSMMVQGEPNSRIAEALEISTGTVRNHKHRLYYKLDITTERELFIALLELAQI